MNNDSHIEDGYLHLLNSLPPEVADRVRDKYEKDRQEFLIVLQDMLPSNKADFWATRSCTKCNGRGIIGVLTKPSGEIVTPACNCTSKNYKKWIKEVRKYYNALKGQST